MAISVQTDMATPALAEFGTDDQRERYLRPAIAGEKIAAIAITEPDAGSDVAGIRTRAVRDGDAWRINGTQDVHHQRRPRRLPHPGRARPNPTRGTAGISLFLVDTDLPGVSVSRKLEKLGMRSSDTAEIALDDVLVPHENLIGARARPGLRAADVAAAVRADLAARRRASGTPTQVLEETIEYARERQAFGRSARRGTR